MFGTKGAAAPIGSVRTLNSVQDTNLQNILFRIKSGATRQFIVTGLSNPSILVQPLLYL